MEMTVGPVQRKVLALRYALVGAAIGMFLLVVATLFLFELRTETFFGYAGDPVQMHDGIVYRTIYFHPEDIDASFVFVAGTHIQQNDLEWTSLGEIPQRGDLVVIKEFRIFTRIGFELVHGFGYTEIYK